MLAREGDFAASDGYEGAVSGCSKGEVNEWMETHWVGLGLACLVGATVGVVSGARRAVQPSKSGWMLDKRRTTDCIACVSAARGSFASTKCTVGAQSVGRIGQVGLGAVISSTAACQSMAMVYAQRRAWSLAARWQYVMRREILNDGWWELVFLFPLTVDGHAKFNVVSSALRLALGSSLSRWRRQWRAQRRTAGAEEMRTMQLWMVISGAAVD